MSDITAEGIEILKCTAAKTPATPAIYMNYASIIYMNNNDKQQFAAIY